MQQLLPVNAAAYEGRSRPGTANREGWFDQDQQARYADSDARCSPAVGSRNRQWIKHLLMPEGRQLRGTGLHYADCRQHVSRHMPDAPDFPFAPKSTRHLTRGQFWAIPLDGGRFGAGCVVGSHTLDGRKSSRMFIAGVVRWVGDVAPTAEDLEGLPLTAFAFAHLKVITESGRFILGETEVELGATPETAEALSLPTWGFGVPKAIAERVGENAG